MNTRRYVSYLEIGQLSRLNGDDKMCSTPTAHISESVGSCIIYNNRPVASHSEGISSYIQHDPPVLQDVFLLTVFQVVKGSAYGYYAPELAYEVAAMKAVSTRTVYTTAANNNGDNVSKKMMMKLSSSPSEASLLSSVNIFFTILSWSTPLPGRLYPDLNSWKMRSTAWRESRTHADVSTSAQ